MGFTKTGAGESLGIVEPKPASVTEEVEPKPKPKLTIVKDETTK
jgi:hypothetical protein